jgi:ATP-binding cassette subfamily C protein
MVVTSPRRRIDLDDIEMVWRVEKGQASVQVEPAPQSGLPRACETLLRVDEGGFVFGMSSKTMPDKVRVFLETTPGAKLMPMMADEFISHCRKAPERGSMIINGAVRQLASSISPGIPSAKVTKMLKPGSNFRLPQGSGVAAITQLWFRAENGSCHYGGAEAAGKISENEFMPLTGNLWLKLGARDRIICVELEDLIKANHFYAAFASFCSMSIRMAFERFSSLELNKVKRLLDSSEHSRDKFSEALTQAASVIDSNISTVSGSASLIDAVRAVGKHLGCVVKQPPRLKQNMQEQLQDILSHNSLFSREVALTGNWFMEDSGPLLGFVEKEKGGQEPVALLPHKNGYRVQYSGGRKKDIVNAENAADISSTAIQLYPPLPPGQLTPLKLTMHSFKGCGREIFLVLLMGLLGSLAGFGIPLAMSITVDKVVTNGEQGLLGQVVLGLVSIVLGNSIFEITKNSALLRAETRAQISLQSAMFGKLLRLPVDFFKKFSAGDLSKRVLAVDGIRQTISGSVLITLLSTSFATTNLVLLTIYSWKLALAVLGVMLLTGLFTYLIMKSQMKFQSKVQDAIGKMAGMELQYVTGINKIRAAGAETNAFARWMENFIELRKITYAIGGGKNVVTVYSTCLPLFSSLLVFGLFIMTGMYQELSLGSFLCFNSAMGQLTGAMASLASIAISLIFIKPMFMRAKPILDATPETNAALEDPGELAGAVETVNLTFTYEGAHAPTLRGVSFKANPGEFVAIVGPSGSGKSTLLKMLLGFNSPLSGSILYDRKPMIRMDPVKIRRQIGSVIQNSELIQGNLYFNIMGTDKNGTEEDAWEAAKLAAVDGDIRNMPMQMQTFVPHGGATFSGGQKQRIMIARALSKKPKIFLLDEATSNLDNTSQTKVMQNLKSINATRIVVAHRLSTIKDADRIYVMHQGQIVENGNFDKLMEKKGLFFKLASRQM